jgi:hypothetical protein
MDESTEANDLKQVNDFIRPEGAFDKYPYFR